MIFTTMLGGLVSAHHAVVGYDRKKTVTMKGVVTEWRWRNPHAFLVFDVKDESAVPGTGDRNTFKRNWCVTYSGPGPAVCPNFPGPRGGNDDNDDD